jgi:predicted MFS family arabinose efflux permease
VLRSSLHGNTELLSDRRVRDLLLAQWVPAWFVTGAESLIVSYVGARGEAASGAGALLAALPIGMLTGALVLGRFCRPRTRERLALPLAVALGLPLLVFAARPSLPVAAALLVVSGGCCGYGIGIQRIFVDSLPPGRRGQAFGLATTGMMGGQGLSPPLAGAFAVAVGVGGAMAACGGLVVLSALALRRALSPGPPGAPGRERGAPDGTDEVSPAAGP